MQYSNPATLPIIFDRQNIDDLVAYRDQHPLERLGDLSQVPGLPSGYASAWLPATVAFKGSYFQVISRGRVNQGTRRMEAVIEKSGSRLTSLKVE